MPQTERSTLAEIAAGARRHEPAERKRKSGPALGAFFRVADRWALDLRQQCGLLGWQSKSTLYNWRSAPDDVTVPYDVLIRLSLILGICKALHILYPDAGFAAGWMVAFRPRLVRNVRQRPLRLRLERRRRADDPAAHPMAADGRHRDR